MWAPRIQRYPAQVGMNQDWIGRTVPASNTYVVGREKIREFAAAIGEVSPVCNDVDAARQAGYADVIAPPTFAIVMSMRALSAVIHDPDLGLDFARVVHGDQRFRHQRPIVAGDELRVDITIESIRSMAGNDILSARADITDASGQAVCSTWSTLVAREAAA